MSLDELLRSPWFYKSPGPLSLFFYGTIILSGAWVLTKRVTYTRWKWVNAFTESFFLNGFIFLSGDLLWISASILRFLPMYPESLNQAITLLARDLLGLLFCFLLIGQRLKDKIISFKQHTFLSYFVLTSFFVICFLVAKDPTFTDWTYAVRVGASTETILVSLFVCYGIGKMLSVVLVYSWWKR